ncbi:MAG TPA: response regulator transcription factor [Candidatus Saccharimonadales bacterium]|nr:response regulator transcription factor [Candidatus Saccharimonadales bacterium]
MTGERIPQMGRRRTYRVVTLMKDPELASAAEFALTHGTYLVRHVRSTAELTATLREWDPDLAFVDVDVEQGIALDILCAPGLVRRIPTIAVTRNGELREKLSAFDRGADDILNIPFLPEELVARAQALIRRSYPEGIDLIAAVRLGEIEVDILARTVTIGGRRVDLSPLEHGLFWILASNAGSIVSRERIEQLLWGSALGTSSNVVQQYVRRLRAKLGDDAKRSRFIQTVRGEGYRFEAKA